MAKLSIIIPVLNERVQLGRLLQSLQGARRKGHELLVVDGGSDDGSREAFEGLADEFIRCPPGRSLQMNAGADHASGNILLFLHVDSVLPENFDHLISNALLRKPWGRFDVALSGSGMGFKIISWFINWRSHLTAVCTGDQGLFVYRDVFFRLGRFAEIPLMEDIEFTKKARRLSRPYRIRQALITSSRRWESQGTLRTVVFMWWLRLQYFSGVSPDKLARHYYPGRYHD